MEILVMNIKENNKVILEIGAFMRPDYYVSPFLGKDGYEVILIDAQPEILDRLKENVSQYGNVRCLNYGLNLENGTKEFYFPSAKVSCDEGWSSAGTFNYDHYKAPFFHHRIEDCRKFHVECYTFHDLIDKIGIGNDIELLILDIETLDCKVIQQIDFSKVSIKTICFEAGWPEWGSQEPLRILLEETISFLNRNGYVYSKRSSLDHANVVFSKTAEGLELVG